jgi:hypothetical protein
LKSKETVMTRIASKNVKPPVDAQVVESLARDLADYRLGGCPSGGGEEIRSRVKKIASKHGQSYGELWARVHATAYQIIDDDGRADLR